jgi:hypothetical protein
MTIDTAKQLAYSYDREEHTARLLRETNPQIAINGAEMGVAEEKAVFEGGSKAEDNFAMDTAAIPAQGFQGA